MGWALHGANILILCSFLVRDILALRLLSIGAGILFCSYFYAHGMMEPIIWNVLFSIVNSIQIGRMWYSRRKVPLCSEEQFLQERFFPSLQPLEIRSLFQCAQKHESRQAEKIELSGLALVIHGVVESNQAHISAGSFWGVRGFLERKDPELMGMVQGQLSCLFWATTDIRAWADKDPDRNNLLLRALSNDLLNKMGKASKEASHRSTKM
jgi:hypothetical protein